MRIELHPRADEEFAAQVAYHEQREPGLGRRFYDEVIAHFDWIAANPKVPRLRKGYRRVNLKSFGFTSLTWSKAIESGSSPSPMAVRGLDTGGNG